MAPLTSIPLLTLRDLTTNITNSTTALTNCTAALARIPVLESDVEKFRFRSLYWKIVLVFTIFWLLVMLYILPFGRSTNIRQEQRIKSLEKELKEEKEKNGAQRNTGVGASQAGAGESEASGDDTVTIAESLPAYEERVEMPGEEEKADGEAGGRSYSRR
jgi:flagellar biosynthesis/type III secretory pathway M-ring protein FliF/YscJ